MLCSLLEQSSFFFPVDTVCCWTGLCHWTGEDIPIFLSKAQDKGNQFLPGRCVCGTAWLAYCWSCSGTLWLFPPVQVRADVEEPISTKITKIQLHPNLILK